MKYYTMTFFLTAINAITAIGALVNLKKKICPSVALSRWSVQNDASYYLFYCKVWYCVFLRLNEPKKIILRSPIQC